MIATGIKQIFYAEPSVIVADLTPLALKTLLAGNSVQSVPNVHGDTWSLDEAEASATPYKNALSGKTYRRDVEPGEIKASFTIGEYDYETKKELIGGEVIKTGSGDTQKIVGWKRGNFVEKHKAMIFLTKDNQYCVFPYASVSTREASTDKAIGLAVSAVPLESTTAGVDSEYWFDKAEVDSAVAQG